MDEARIIRFITPATFFIASLFFGAWLDEPKCSGVFNGDLPNTIAIIAGATTALFPLGFVITGVFTLVLRAVFCLYGKTYQISLSDNAWVEVWSKLGLGSIEKTKANKVYAALIFDHHILEKDIHAAAVRLWSAFNIAVASFTASILALLVGCLVLHIRCTCTWVIFTGCLLLLLGSIAVVTWRDHMGLIEFEAMRTPERQPPSRQEKSVSGPSNKKGQTNRTQ